MNIEYAIELFPDYAQSWAKRELEMIKKETGQLPPDYDIITIINYLYLLGSNHPVRQGLQDVAWSTMLHHREVTPAEEGDDSGTLFLECRDGYKWVELTTSPQLDFEHDNMGQCPSLSECNRLGIRIFSLRNEHNQPCMTVKYSSKDCWYEEIRGQNTSRAPMKYWFAAQALFDALPGDNDNKAFANNQEYIVVGDKIYIGAQVYPILSTTTEGISDVYLEKTPYGLSTEDKLYWLCEGQHIPDDTVFKFARVHTHDAIKDWRWDVNGYFDACNSLLQTVKDGLHFGGDVDVSNTPLTHWGCDVAGDFVASNSMLSSVSDGLYFGEDVDVSSTPIAYWGCDVAGDFDASRCFSLKTVKDSLRFKGKVDISGTPLTHWGCDVAGNFCARLSGLESIDSRASFHGDIDITKTKIIHWECSVKGNFLADYTPLETIKDGVKFYGSVSICRTNVTHWSHDVAGNFIAERSGLISVEKGCKFKGNVDITDTYIKRWECDVAGNFIADLDSLDPISDDVKIGGEVIDGRWES